MYVCVCVSDNKEVMFSASCRCDTDRQPISLSLSFPSQHSTHARSNKLLNQQLQLNVSSQQLAAIRVRATAY